MAGCLTTADFILGEAIVGDRDGVFVGRRALAGAGENAGPFGNG
jgi:hypothetical protein